LTKQDFCVAFIERILHLKTKTIYDFEALFIGILLIQREALESCYIYLLAQCE